MMFAIDALSYWLIRRFLILDAQLQSVVRISRPHLFRPRRFRRAQLKKERAKKKERKEEKKDADKNNSALFLVCCLLFLNLTKFADNFDLIVTRSKTTTWPRHTSEISAKTTASVRRRLFDSSFAVILVYKNSF